MSAPTLATVKPIISESAYRQLTSMFTNEEPQELFRPEGGTLAKEHDVQIERHRDETDTIDGIFLHIAKIFRFSYNFLNDIFARF